MKNRRAIITLFAANLISGISQGITMIAVPWYFTMHENMSLFGVLFIVSNLIALLWVPTAGILVDRYNRKRIFQVLTFSVGSILLALGLYGYLQGGLSLIMVGSAFMITFFNYNIHYPTIYAFMQEVTEEKYYDKIASALEIQHQVAIMISGALAAWLLIGTLSGEFQIFGIHFPTSLRIEPWTISEIILLDASTYFIGFLFICTIVYTSLKERKAEVGGLGTRLRIGFQYLNEHRDITFFGVASHSIFVTAMVTGFYIFPLYVSNHLKETGDVYATIDMYYGLAAVTAGIMIHAIFRRTTIPTAIAILSLVMGGIYLLMFATKVVALFYFVGFMLGLCNAGSRILRVTYLFRHIPNQVFGRTSSAFTIINILFRIFFLLIFSIPFFTQGNHIIWACVILAGFVIFSGWLLFQSQRRLEQVR